MFSYVKNSLFLSSLFSIYSVEYPYELPQREENIQPSSNPVETITGLAKNMKLNGTKTIDGQGCLLKFSYLNSFSNI